MLLVSLLLVVLLLPLKWLLVDLLFPKIKKPIYKFFGLKYTAPNQNEEGEETEMESVQDGMDLHSTSPRLFCFFPNFILACQQRN